MYTDGREGESDYTYSGYHLNVFIAHAIYNMQIWNSYRFYENFNHSFFSSVIKHVIKSECEEMTSQHLGDIRNLLVLRTEKKESFKALTLAEKWLHIKDSWIIQYVLLPYTWFNLS